MNLQLAFLCGSKRRFDFKNRIQTNLGLWDLKKWPLLQGYSEVDP
jgi:hypothetical protein